MRIFFLSLFIITLLFGVTSCSPRSRQALLVGEYTNITQDRVPLLLTLGEDGSALLTILSGGGEDLEPTFGSWRETGAGNILVTFDGSTNANLHKAITFKAEDDQLLAVIFDRSEYGETPLTFRKIKDRIDSPLAQIHSD